jgi:hypothetical protein
LEGIVSDLVDVVLVILVVFGRLEGRSRQSG